MVGSQYLQQGGNVKLLELIYAAAYTAVVTLMVVFETSYRQGMVGLCKADVPASLTRA